jgi:hypothetical protein
MEGHNVLLFEAIENWPEAAVWITLIIVLGFVAVVFLLQLGPLDDGHDE